MKIQRCIPMNQKYGHDRIKGKKKSSEYISFGACTTLEEKLLTCSTCWLSKTSIIIFRFPKADPKAVSPYKVHTV